MIDPRRIAEAAARGVVEEGLDYAAAKRKAVRQLGGSPRTPLPSNEAVEDAVRDYLAVFCADEQPAQLRFLRELALQWMQRLRAWQPLLTGAVWRGTATRHSDIHLHLYCDDPKAAEFALLDLRYDFEAHEQAGPRGEDLTVLSTLLSPRDERWPADQGVWVHLTLHPLDDIRGTLKPDAQGERAYADLAALQTLLDAPPAAADGRR
jgi:hypothetical protein